MERGVGFAIHSSKKWQAARAAFASVFAFTAVLVMIISEGKPLGDIFSTSPALILAAVLFLVFSLLLLRQLHHVLMTRFVLEFTDRAIVDRRRLKARSIPYSLVEIFSPVPEDLFQNASMAQKFRTDLGIEDYVSISCRLRDGREQDALNVSEDFVFFEMVKSPTYDMQQAIVKRLREKIARFELLVQDDEAGFGDDETNA